MYDIITTVPLHDSRLKQRGYNQSDEWARGISESTGITFVPSLLERRHKTETQTKRTKMSRWENVREIFFVQKPESILGKRILLADDVVTTGATLESCGQTLLQGFCDRVGIVCIAATVWTFKNHLLFFKHIDQKSKRARRLIRTCSQNYRLYYNINENYNMKWEGL